MSGFDSSDDENTQEVDLSPFEISWLDLSDCGIPESLGISGLPGRCFKETWRDLRHDIKCLTEFGVTDMFCLCTKGELIKYRVPSYLQDLGTEGIVVHHYPFLDGLTPAMSDLVKMLDEIKVNLMNSKKTVIHCYGGYGRSCCVVACLMLILQPDLDPEEVITKIRDLRGPRAIQTVKQFNFIHEFQLLYDKFLESDDVRQSRSLSR